MLNPLINIKMEELLSKLTAKEAMHLQVCVENAFKICKRKLKPNFLDILKDAMPFESFDNGVEKYAGLEVWCIYNHDDWWILEENDTPLTNYCFEEQ